MNDLELSLTSNLYSRTRTVKLQHTFELTTASKGAALNTGSLLLEATGSVQKRKKHCWSQLVKNRSLCLQRALYSKQ